MAVTARSTLETFLRLPATLGQRATELAPLTHWPKLLAAVSGGGDSIALFDCLDALRHDMQFHLEVIHVHHGLRGEAADQDAQFVRRLCEQRGVPYHLVVRDTRARMTAQHLSLEEAARAIRYEAFIEVARQVDATAVIVAHHLDDDVETLLMRLITGSSLSGLAGMEQISVRQGVPIWRPFLRTSQSLLYQHLTEQKLPWRFDASNLETGQLRNRIRQELLPRLRTDFNPQLVRTLGKLLQELKALRTAELPVADSKRSPSEWLTATNASDEGPQIGAQLVPVEEWQFPVAALQGLEQRERWSLWRAVVRGLGIPAKQLQRSMFEDLDTLISRTHGTLAIALPGGLEARRTYGTLVFGPRLLEDAQPLPVSLPVTNWSWTDRYPGWVILIEPGGERPDDTTDTSPGHRWWERAVFQGYLQIPEEVDRLEVRSREPGDEIPVLSGRHNSLKEWFIDQKLPQLFRDRWPVVALPEGSPLWVPGLTARRDDVAGGREMLLTAVKTAHWG